MHHQKTLRILVIEDDDAVRQMLVRALRFEGHRVVSIDTFSEAAEVPEAPLNLIVTNSRMPYLSGLDLVAELHRHWPGVPVLHLDDLTRPLSSALPGNVPSLMKPFSVESLLVAVQHITTERRKEARPV